MENGSQDIAGESPSNGLSENKLRAEIKNIEASTKKFIWEAANAKTQNKELRRKRFFFGRILSTTQVTVVLALMTLTFQIIQFGYTARQDRLAAESKEWKDTIRGITFDGGSKSVGEALALETFFDSDAYSADAKTTLAAVLPFIENNDAFDHLFVNLLRYDSWKEPCCQTYVVSRSVALAYTDQAWTLYGDSRSSLSARGVFRSLLSQELINRKAEAGDAVELAKRREWQIDTITHGLLDFWSANGTRPQNVDSSYSMDLRSIILRFDDDQTVNLSGKDFSRVFFRGAYLHSVDFSNSDLRWATLADTDMGNANLTNTKLDGVSVAGANLDNVTQMSGSTWTGVSWWQAYRLSPALCEWLKGHGAPLPTGKIANNPCADRNKNQAQRPQ